MNDIKNSLHNILYIFLQIFPNIGYDQYMFVTNMRYVEKVTSTKTNFAIVVTWTCSVLSRILANVISTTSFTSDNHSIENKAFESQQALIGLRILSITGNQTTSSNISTLQPKIISNVVCKDNSEEGFMENYQDLFGGINFLLSFLLPTFALIYFYGKIYVVAKNSIEVCLTVVQNVIESYLSYKIVHIII